MDVKKPIFFTDKTDIGVPLAVILEDGTINKRMLNMCGNHILDSMPFKVMFLWKRYYSEDIVINRAWHCLALPQSSVFDTTLWCGVGGYSQMRIGSE